MTKTISIYFNGTDKNNIITNEIISLATLLHLVTVKNNQQQTICIKGCGTETKDYRDKS